MFAFLIRVLISLIKLIINDIIKAFAEQIIIDVEDIYVGKFI